MQRRSFLTFLGGTAAAWPLAARAQQPERMRRIGVLLGLTESDPEGPPRVAIFKQELQNLGWTENRNIQIEYRWAGGDADRTRTLAAELAGTMPDVAVAPKRIGAAHLTNQIADVGGHLRPSRSAGP